MTIHYDLWHRLNDTACRLSSDVKVSFEFFPVVSEKAKAQFSQDIRKLAELSPEFVSVTYGAQSGNTDNTKDTIELIQSETPCQVAAHMTCAGLSEQQTQTMAEHYWQSNVKHIVALRGDACTDNNRYAVDLVKQLKNVADFDISVAAYPETHPEAPSQQFDIDNLLQKFDAGANRAITQFFFDPSVFLSFQENVKQYRPDASIIPGILPVYQFEQMKSFAQKTQVTVPDWMESYYANTENDPLSRQMIGLSLALEQVKFLLNAGVNEFHFYTLNRSSLVYPLCQALGVGKQKAA